MSHYRRDVFSPPPLARLVSFHLRLWLAGPFDGRDGVTRKSRSLRLGKQKKDDDVWDQFDRNGTFAATFFRRRLRARSMDPMTQSTQISSSQGLADGQNSAVKEQRPSGKNRSEAITLNENLVFHILIIWFASVCCRHSFFCFVYCRWPLYCIEINGWTCCHIWLKIEPAGFRLAFNIFICSIFDLEHLKKKKNYWNIFVQNVACYPLRGSNRQVFLKAASLQGEVPSPCFHD